MRFIYDVRNNPNVSEMFADILAVLTGETDKNNLTCAELNLAGTSISANTPAGWELYDTTTGIADQAIIRAPMVDDPTQYKYARIYVFLSTTYRIIQMTLMESWDSGTNTATNESQFQQQTMMRASTGAYGIQPIEIRATARYIWSGNQGAYTSLNRSALLVCELNRIHPCMGIGSGYLPAITCAASWGINTSSLQLLGSMCRIIDDAGTSDLTGTNADCYLYPSCTPVSCLTTVEPYSHFGYDRATDKNGQVHYAAHLVQADRKNTVGHIAGTSAPAHVYMAQPDAPGSANGAGPGQDEILWLKDVGMMRCKWDRWTSVTLAGYHRWLFRMEDE